MNYHQNENMGTQGANIRLEGFLTMWQEIKRRKIRGRGGEEEKEKEKEKGKKDEIIHQ